MSHLLCEKKLLQKKNTPMLPFVLVTTKAGYQVGKKTSYPQKINEHERHPDNDVDNTDDTAQPWYRSLTPASWSNVDTREC